MELENTNAAMQPESPDLELSEPHFEDEETLLSARPVVPLEEAPTLDEVEPAAEVERTSSRIPGGWILAATVVGAMFLGALGSAFYLSLTNPDNGGSILESETVAADVVGEISEPARNNPIVVPAAASNDQPAVEANPEAGDSQQTQVAQRQESDNDVRRPVARRVEVLTYPSTREERKAARRVAKEQRRDFERENRRSRDLTRIREIFEGTQRP